MDEDIKNNFPDILTQKLYDQIPENVMAKLNKLQNEIITMLN